MAPNATKTRANFLEKASQLLATASPAVSAELQSTRRDFGDEPTGHRPQTCVACGRILILGWNCALFKDSKTPRRTRQDRLTKKETTKSVQLQCSGCSSITTIQSEKPGPKRVRKVCKGKPEAASAILKPADHKQPSSTPTISTSPSTTAPESGSKKRGRKKKSNLQSMLADRKSIEQKKGSGLDLMDFMKT